MLSFDTCEGCREMPQTLPSLTVVRREPRYGWRDLVIAALVLGMFVLVATGIRGIAAPFEAAQAPAISLDPSQLPGYALRTVMRMLVALLLSLVFTLAYATPAAKSRRAEAVLIPLLDVLQSVPILGYLSFTVVFFLALFPHRALGPELASIFAIFTSQAWNMAFSFYQSLKTMPRDLDEASRSFRASAWQRFWRLEVPFALPGLVWNMMMSMSGGWFFVVASEAISVGNVQVALPGVGSYVAVAIGRRDLAAIGWAIVAMTVVIALYDQLLFRPLVAWADRFRYEQTAAQVAPRSWVLDLCRRSAVARRAVAPLSAALQRAARARMSWHFGMPHNAAAAWRRLQLPLWLGVLALASAWLVWQALHAARATLSWHDAGVVAINGALTLARVAVLVALAALVWVPLGVMIGLRPAWAARVQPVAQFLAAFPANLLFPVVVYLIVHFGLSPRIWLPPLMILGTQWYLLFNVIAGASAYPGDLREAARCFRIRGWRWWKYAMLPGIFPYFVTGAISASGGAWNASIVAEAVSWGPTRLSAGGLGAYIAQMTGAGDYPRIGLGIAMMSLLIILTNRLLWRPLYAYAERRTRLA